MAELNETLVEVTPKEEKADVAQEVKEASENTIENNVVAKEETYECEKCDRIFPIEQKRNLHMSRAHNMKVIKSTPYPARRKVGRPQTRFICDSRS